MRYRVHKLDFNVNKDQNRLEDFLNELKGEVVAIIPSVKPRFTPGGMGAQTRLLLIVEKTI